MLAFVQVVAPELVIVGAVVVVLGLLLILEYVLLPFLDWLNQAKLPWWKKALVWPVRVLKPRVNSIIRKIKSQLGNRLIRMSPPVARWLHAQALIVEQLSGHVMADAQWTYEALYALRNTTIPTLIERAVAPVRTIAQTALKEERAIKVQLDTARGYVNQRLRSLPWGTGTTFELMLYQFSGAFVHLWNQVYNDLLPAWRTFIRVTWPAVLNQVDVIWRDLYTTGRDSLANIRARLSSLETNLLPLITDPTTWILGALGLAVVPALTATGMRTALRNLTCNNTQTVARQLCSMDEQLIQELIAGTLLFSLLLDPREVARVGQETEALIGDAWRTMAGL